MNKNTVCLWFDKEAEDAARFYTNVFPDSHIHSINRAPADYPGGKAGNVLTVSFTVAGIPCLGLNGGNGVQHTEAFSFQMITDSQEETDRYWRAIVDNGGREVECGWCIDRWGVRWQIIPRVLMEALDAGGETSKRAFAAMMGMVKIDIAALEKAIAG